MEDAIKNTPYVRPGVGRPSIDDRTDDHPVSANTTPTKAPAGTRRQDRWFVDERGGTQVARRLNIVNEAEITSRGPIRLKGNITLIDEEGEKTFHNDLALCRCGASQNKPMCDKQHMEIEFFDNGGIMQASQTPRSRTPQPLNVQIIRNGPLLFRGYLRVFNSRGQETCSRKGALCRCGRSSKKPFCDCYRG